MMPHPNEQDLPVRATKKSEGPIAPDGWGSAESSASGYLAAPVNGSDRQPHLTPHLLHYDGLTGLASRMALIHRIRYLIQKQTLLSPQLQFIYFDLDRFKAFNSSLGYEQGDRLLNQIVQRIKPYLTEKDTFARLDGDAFGILLEDSDNPHRLVDLISEIRADFQQPFQVDEGKNLFITASFGGVTDTTSYQQPETLIRDAEIAMYHAKSSGAGTFAIFTQEMYDHARNQLELEMAIHRAMDCQEFVLYYQPIMSAVTDQIAGFEALLRWQHPDKGMISPGTFIPIAEETGLIIPIGVWALETACRQLKQWQTQFPDLDHLYVSVNLSAKQFSQPDLVNAIQHILVVTGIDAQSLCLEITESTVMDDVEHAIDMLQELKALGIRLSIDDFGTGYSSLGYLHRFPVDTLKLDQSFIYNIDVDAEKIGIIQMVVTLAWNIGLNVVAEGVEKATQLSQLRALRCDSVQGYYFAKPLDAIAATAFLAKDSDC